MEKTDLNVVADAGLDGAQTGTDIGNQSVNSELSIPDEWGKGMKEFISSLTDENAKRTFYDRAKDLHGRIDSRSSELAEHRKKFESERTEWQKSRAEVEAWDSWAKGMSPTKLSKIRENYGDLSQYISHLDSLNEMADTNPDEFIARLLQGYGITAENAAEKVAALMGGAHGVRIDMDSRFRDFERKTEERLSAEFSKREAQKEWNDFINSKDSNGNPAYPLIDNPNVKKEMSIEINANPDMPLPDLYNRAVRILGLNIQNQEAAISEDVNRKSVAAGISGGAGVAKNPKKSLSSNEVLATELAKLRR